MRKKFLHTFGSLKLAIFLILALAGVCTYATFFESAYGTQAVQHSIYKTFWFGLLLIFIALSVACAALKKYPWKHHQVGFVLTHLGILILIAGSFVSFMKGIDATLSFQNGETKTHYICSDEIFAVTHVQTSATFSKTMETGPYPREDSFASFSFPDQTNVVVDRFYPHAAYETETIAHEQGSGSAISVRLQNQFVNTTEWLYFDMPTQAQTQLGPAQISFKQLSETDLKYFLQKTKKKQSLIGEIKLITPQKTYSVPFHEKEKSLQVPGTSFQLKNIQYFPDAAVINNKLVNRSPEAKNPALKLELFGNKGTETHVSFALFPQFPSTHQQNSLYDSKIEFVSAGGLPSEQKSLQIGKLNDTLYYRVNSSKGIQTGKVEVGKSYETGWMELKFTIEKFYPKALQKINYRPIRVKDPNNPKVPSAVRFTFSKNAKQMHAWLYYGEVNSVFFEKDEYRITYQPKMESLGFALQLEKFEMGVDPGTDNPASYQSRVILKDTLRNVNQSHLISMNEPLDYKGFTFYQSSFFKDESGQPIGSVLSVGYDPGRNLKYGGSILMVLGILLMFFFRQAYIDAYRKLKNRGK